MYVLSDALNVTLLVLAIVFGVIAAGVAVLFVVFRMRDKKAKKGAEDILKEAKIKAEHLVKGAQLDAKQAAFEIRQQAENEARARKAEVAAEEQKLSLRQDAFETRENALLEKERVLEDKKARLDDSIESYKKRNAELDQKIDDILKELEKVAGMSTAEAHDEIMARVESKMSMEIAAYIKNAEDEARETAQAKAVDLLAMACQRYAQDVTTERTVSVVALPSDEMKGRIIGREGRNIRVLEAELGVDLVIDDTPEAITVSCFDPIRREIARRALEYLVKDGRIQPGRIEEVVAKCRKEVEESTFKYGEEACFKLGLPRINRELVSYIGRLHYRTSYGQNGLTHSMEVAYLTGIMAGELGLDVNLARRAGLLHDIGKSVDFELEGSHVQLGAQLAKKYGENEVVINAIESHHGDVEARSVIAYLVAAADALSAARPGARSETLETYVKRIEQLETIAKSFDGVQQAYAMQSGREVRVMVIPERVSDAEAIKMAQQMRERIEQEVTYPGQIKVSVIREYRAVETAK
ncbi:MAG: ribonuclease Y [Bacilli bacterium]|nr:ribonuclease Y [Bacilli bacterium]MDY6392909.1 ribonuclease Y [Bacilli bacterium]